MTITKVFIWTCDICGCMLSEAEGACAHEDYLAGLEPHGEKWKYLDFDNLDNPLADQLLACEDCVDRCKNVKINTNNLKEIKQQILEEEIAEIKAARKEISEIKTGKGE